MLFKIFDKQWLLMAPTCAFKQVNEWWGILASFRIWAVIHTELLTYNIYTSGSNITCSTALWASVQRWMWLISKWLEHSTCNVGRKTSMYFQLFMLEWGQLWKSTKWGNKEPPPACCRNGTTHFSSISGIFFFFFRSVPWLWHNDNAGAYDVNKHPHCRHALLIWMAEMAVGEQRKEVMPQFLWLQPSLYEHVKENCPGVISMSLSDVGTMLTILLRLS